MMTRIFAILLVATACGGIIFNSTTIAMPKVFDERLQALTQTNFGIGALVAGVFVASWFFPSRAELTAHKEKLAGQPA